MPDEIKYILNSSTNHTPSRNVSAAGSSTATVMVWTVSGIVLAACGSSSDGAGGGAHNLRYAADGPIRDAAIYPLSADTDSDGEISPAEAREYDGGPVPRHKTNDEGWVTGVPSGAFIAVVEGATDTHTGAGLEGQYRSLPSGGNLASPLTHLINQRIGVDGDDAAAQDALNDIYGMQQGGAPVITVDDILNIELYRIQVRTDPDTVRTLPAEPTAEQMESYKAWVITRAAIALTEMDQTSDPYNTVDERIRELARIFDGDDDTAIAPDLEGAIDARQDEGEAILRGKPVAAPDTSVEIDEDQEFQFNQDVFGFLDRGGNHENPSTFTGVFIETAALNAAVMFDDAVLMGDQAGGGTPPIDSPEDGFTYVAVGDFSRLTLQPDADHNNVGHPTRGPVEVDYYVFDGEQLSVKRTLKIDVNPIDDAPSAITLMDLRSTIVISEASTGGVKVADIETTDVDDRDGPNSGLELTGADADMFMLHDSNDDDVYDQILLRANDQISARILNVTVRASGNHEVSEDIKLRIGEGSLLIERDDVQISSGGDGLLEESTDYADNPFTLGELMDTFGSTEFALDRGHKPNEHFRISRNMLIYQGPSAGDFEAGDTITLRITATGGTPPLFEYEYVITLINVNDNLPELTIEETQTGANVVLEEGRISAGTDTGYRITAVDPDTGVSALSVAVAGTFTDAEGNVIPSDAFRITDEGRLEFSSDIGIDFEALTGRTIDLTITAADSGVGVGSQETTDTETVSITITDVNEAPTATAAEGLSVTVSFPGRAFRATDFGFMDEDAGDDEFTTVTIAPFDLAGGSLNVSQRTFTLEEINNGALVFTAASTQTELSVNATFTYTVADDEGLRSAPTILTIASITNLSATAIRLDSQALSTIAENTDVTDDGMLVATFEVTDDDFAPHRLVLAGDHASMFEIRDASTGNEAMLYLTESPNFEDGATLTVMVQIPDADPSVATESITVNVAVTDVNEAPTVSESEDTVEIGENDTGMTAEHVFIASDPDAGDNVVNLTLLSASEHSTSTSPGAEDFVGGSPFLRSSFPLSGMTPDTLQGRYGMFILELGSNGEVKVQFDLAEGNRDVQRLDSGEFLYETFYAYIEDNELPTAARSEAYIYRVTITGVNDAPTGATLSSSALSQRTNTVGTLIATDPDDTTGFRYAVTGGADRGLFSVNASSELVFSRSSNQRKSPGETYVVEVTVTDDGGAVSEPVEFTITEGGIYLDKTPDDTENDDRFYSEYKDADNNGLIPENKDGTDTTGATELPFDDFINLGRLGYVGSTTTLMLAEADEGNDNDKFELNSDGDLLYIGDDSGDFEAGDSLTVEVGLGPSRSVVPAGGAVPEGHFLYSLDGSNSYRVDESSSGDYHVLFSRDPATITRETPYSVVLYRENSAEAIEFVEGVGSVDLSVADTTTYVYAINTGSGVWFIRHNTETLESGDVTNDFYLLYKITTGANPGSDTPTLGEEITAATALPAHRPAQFVSIDPSFIVSADQFVYLSDPTPTANILDGHYIVTDKAIGDYANGDSIEVTFYLDIGQIDITATLDGYRNSESSFNVWAVQATGSDEWSIFIDATTTSRRAPADFESGYADTVFLWNVDSAGQISDAQAQAAGTFIDSGGEHAVNHIGETENYVIYLSDVEPESGLFITRSISDPDTYRYSEYEDAEGDGLIPENKDGSDISGATTTTDDDPLSLGTLASLPNRAIKLALTPSNPGVNDNDKFRILSDGTLEFIGKNSGDFENGDSLMIEVGYRPDATLGEDEEQDIFTKTEVYVINLADRVSVVTTAMNNDNKFAGSVNESAEIIELSNVLSIGADTAELRGNDAEHFEIRIENGNARIVSKNPLDFETPLDTRARSIYEFTFAQVNNGVDVETHDFVITVSNVVGVNDTITLSRQITSELNRTVSVAETSDGLRVFESDPSTPHTVISETRANIPSSGVVVELSGADAGKFKFIQIGTQAVVVSKGGFDFEARASANGDNVYNISVDTRESFRLTSRDYTITITDVAANDPQNNHGQSASAASEAYYDDWPLNSLEDPGLPLAQDFA